MRARATALASAPTIPIATETHATSHELTAAVARGDERAFERFYDLWFDRLLAMARACTRRDEAFCLDVVQDCLVRVVDKLPPLRSEAAVAAWLTRTVLRLAVDRLRAEARRTARQQVVAASRPEAQAANSHRPDAEQVAWLEDRLAELPAADAALLRARFLHGHTAAAAGAQLALTADAAAGRIRRLVLRLKQAAKEIFDV